MRSAGILLPISSLPSPCGIGTLGKSAYAFVDFLAAAGQTLWQILPVGPTGYGDSPYQSFSAFAGNPYFIDLELLVNDGLLLPEEIEGPWGENPARVDYALLFERRFAVLAMAVARQNKAHPAYLQFCSSNNGWLADYALFMAAKEAHGQASFEQWPAPLRLRRPQALKTAMAKWGPRFEFWRCLQFFFFRQWKTLKQYANKQGIRLVGDIPIYVSPDSSDLWANPKLFQVEKDGSLSGVAGVPPDAFSEDGQLWGNPLYNWPYHRRTGYHWWLRRLAHTATLYDVIRIDHFRGFAEYYSIPAQNTTARQGRWLPGPGKDFIRAVHRGLPKADIIAEDLGFLTPDVRELLAYSGYPGMKVLQFAFDGGADNDYLPHNHPKHTVVYTGTHDNATTEGWQRSAPREDLRFARRYLGLGRSQNLTGAMVRAALASVADTAIIPLQDWLCLGEEARINTPATLGGRNWQWRLLPGQLTPALAKSIQQSAALYGRMPLGGSARANRAIADIRAAGRPPQP